MNQDIIDKVNSLLTRSPPSLLTFGQLNELREVHKAKMGVEDKWRVFAYDKGAWSDYILITLWPMHVRPLIPACD